MKLVAAKCPNCKANIDVDKNSDTTVCEYCGSKIIVEDAIAKYKIELSGKVEVSNSTNFNKLLKLADKYFAEKDYEQSLQKYNKAIELEPDDLYVDYRITFIKFILNNDNEKYLSNVTKKLLKTTYSFDDSYNKVEDVSKIYFEYLDTVYEFAKKSYKKINDKTDNSLSLVTSMLAQIQLYFYEFEKLISSEKITGEVRERLLVYLLDIIYFLSSSYNYKTLDRNYIYQDLDNIDAYIFKKNKYYNELITLNNKYVDVLDYAIKKKNVFLYNKLFGSSKHLFSVFLCIVYAVIIFIMIVAIVLGG